MDKSKKAEGKKPAHSRHFIKFAVVASSSIVHKICDTIRDVLIDIHGKILIFDAF